MAAACCTTTTDVRWNGWARKPPTVNTAHGASTPCPSAWSEEKARLDDSQRGAAGLAVQGGRDGGGAESVPEGDALRVDFSDGGIRSGPGDVVADVLSRAIGIGTDGGEGYLCQGSARWPDPEHPRRRWRYSKKTRRLDR